MLLENLRGLTLEPIYDQERRKREWRRMQTFDVMKPICGDYDEWQEEKEEGEGDCTVIQDALKIGQKYSAE